MNKEDAAKNIEHQLSLITAALAECLKEGAPDEDDRDSYRRGAELDQARKLARVSARLAEALARLNGQTRHTIHVMRDGP